VAGTGEKVRRVDSLRPPISDFGIRASVVGFSPNAEVEKRQRESDRGGARRLRRFTCRQVLAARESTAT
jgi:hypothetical protein